MDLFEKLRQKIDKELQAYRKEMWNMPPRVIYESWFCIEFYEEVSTLLMSDYTREHLSDNEIETIVMEENALQFLYDLWMECDQLFDHDWDHLIEWIHRELYEPDFEVN